MFSMSAIAALASVDFYSPRLALTLHLSPVSTTKSVLNLITVTLVSAASGEFVLRLVVQTALNDVTAEAPFGTVGTWRRAGPMEMGWEQLGERRKRCVK